MSDVDLTQSAAEAAARAIEAEGGSAPGTEGEPAPTTQQPPAEASTTETAGSSAPESVPYSRFKEVNDQLRSWKELQGIGHDVDSLRQLAEWERSFNINPGESWMAVANQISDQLPEPVRAAVMLAQQAADGTATPAASATNSEEEEKDEPPEWARPLLEDHEARKQQEQESANDQALQSILDWWLAEDEREQIKSPDRKFMLTFIAGNAGEATTLEDLRQIARNEWKEMREAELKGSVIKPQPGGAPLPVPGGGPASNPPPKPQTLADASRRALADMKSGVLPPPGEGV